MRNRGKSVLSPNFTRYAWGVLAWNLLVVLWGAYVRATGSGAGCGNHWPLCNGQVVPLAPRVATIIEFTHRMMSGVAGIAIAVLFFWSLRRGRRVRWMAALAVVFLLAEVLLGAGLVLLQYVGQNASVGRAVYLSAHLVNTQLLLAALALTAWFSWKPEWARPSGWVLAALPVVVIVSVTGAIVALGDTLFPTSSLAEGMRQDLSSASPMLLRLRLLHPALAMLAAAYLVFVAVSILRPGLSAVTKRAALSVLVLVLAQFTAGVVNLVLLAPVWMQIAHLLLADLLWVALVILVAADDR